MKFTKDTKLKDVLDIEGAEEILTKHSIPCVMCPMAKMEMDMLRLVDICEMYGIDLEDVLHDLNQTYGDKDK